MSENVRARREVDTNLPSYRLNPTTDQQRTTYSNINYEEEVDHVQKDTQINQATKIKPVRPIEPEIIDDIKENPDWKLDLDRSDNQELDGNLNNLMAIVRLTLAMLQQSLRTNERVQIDQKQDQVRERITGSRDTTLHQARILFMQGIVTLTMSITPVLPELSDMKDALKGISDATQLISTTLTKGCDANLGELNNMISLYQQDMQRIQSEADRLSNKTITIDRSLAEMSGGQRVNS